MKIYSLAKGRKTMLFLPGHGHDRISLAEGKSAEALAKFMDECLNYPY
jgi:hypothetical protein